MLKTGDGSAFSVDEYIKKLMSPNSHLGVVELMALAKILNLTVQLWQPQQTKPVVVSAEEQGSGSEHHLCCAYNLMLICLPKSQQNVWLPIVSSNGASSMRSDRIVTWSQRLRLLDDSLTASSTAATEALNVPRVIPPRPRLASALVARLQGTGPMTRSAARAKATAQSGCKRPCPSQEAVHAEKMPRT